MGPEVVIIRAGRLVDVVAGEVVPDREVVIGGGRIQDVQPAGGEVPAGARVVDLSRRASWRQLAEAAQAYVAR